MKVDNYISSIAVVFRLAAENKLIGLNDDEREYLIRTLDKSMSIAEQCRNLFEEVSPEPARRGRPAKVKEVNPLDGKEEELKTAWYAGNDKDAPSQAQLAEKYNCTERDVRLKLRELGLR